MILSENAATGILLFIGSRRKFKEGLYMQTT